MTDWQVVCGDCREVLREMDSGSVQLVVTSPPYAQGLEYEQGLDWHGLRELMAGVAEVSLDVVKPGGFCFVNFGETTKYPQTMAELYNGVFREAGWVMHSRRIWHKSFAQCRLTGAMITSTIPAAEWEYLWTFRKPPTTAETHRDKSLSLRGVWTTDEQIGINRGEHPAAFPPELAAKAIRVWSDPGDLVCDPFCGSGSTGIAAIREGRSFVGIELSEEYCALSRRRIGSAQAPLFADAESQQDQQRGLPAAQRGTDPAQLVLSDAKGGE